MVYLGKSVKVGTTVYYPYHFWSKTKYPVSSRLKAVADPWTPTYTVEMDIF